MNETSFFVGGIDAIALEKKPGFYLRGSKSEARRQAWLETAGYPSW